MGQRLVIDLIIDDEVKANCYMHWEAYTVSTLYVLRDIIEIVEKYDNVKKDTDAKLNLGFNYYSFKDDMSDPLLWAVRIFEKISNISYHTSVIEHPGLDSTSYDYMIEKFPDQSFHTAIDRNIGIIHVTEDTMQNANNWAEGKLSIDLTNRRFSLDVYWLFTSIGNFDNAWFNEYCEIFNYEGTKEQLLDELPKINIDLGDWIPFNKIHELMDELGITDDNSISIKRVFISNGNIISMIY